METDKQGHAKKAGNLSAEEQVKLVYPNATVAKNKIGYEVHAPLTTGYYLVFGCEPITQKSKKKAWVYAWSRIQEMMLDQLEN